MRHISDFSFPSLSRREFLQLLGTSLAATGLSSPAWAMDPKPRKTPIIDVHCHLMRVGDISANGVTRRYAPGDLTGTIDFIVRVITGRPASHPIDFQRIENTHRIEEVKALIKELEADYKRKNPHYFANDAKPKSKKHFTGEDDHFRGQVGWVNLMTFSKTSIAQRMLRAFPEIQLFTPAMIDFDGWLDLEAEHCIAHQIEQLEYLVTSRKYIPRAGANSRVSQSTYNDTHIMPIISFNPLKCVLVPNYFELIEEALLHRGFVGVKLYTPSGFLPHSNKADHVRAYVSETYREKLRRSCKCSDEKIIAGSIDEALNRLYRLCNDHEIPIMTHSDRDAAKVSKGTWVLSDPRNWETVLESCPKLKINFAHFGGDWLPHDGTRYQTKNSWSSAIAGLMGRFKGRVFADLGLHLWPRGNSGAKGQKYEDHFKCLLRRPEVKNGLMYGSDWHMLYRYKNHDNYYKMFRQKMDNMCLNEQEKEAFFGGNALRFLGLDKPGNLRYERALCFYRRNMHRRSPDWLGQWSPSGWMSERNTCCPYSYANREELRARKQCRRDFDRQFHESHPKCRGLQKNPDE